ncbi:hypothetical protein [Actinomycetospora aeridis]|uniref:Uncharacterized protein n=1 Tax=Actinomycetospora aeridis TaxID=3129231 RepID=A0ABU8NA84_9PSEU
MTSIELEDATAAALRSAAARAGLSVDAYVRHLQVQDSIRQHAAWEVEHADEALWAAEEAEAAQAEAGAA